MLTFARSFAPQDASDEDCCIALHQLSYDQNSASTAVSGCQERCLIERRPGSDNACLPAHDECLDEESADASSWTTPRYVNTMCICGGRFNTNPDAGLALLKQDGEACAGEDVDCVGSSICFNGFCRPPGRECDACSRSVDCDVAGLRGLGTFKCSYGQCTFDGESGGKAPDSHACIENQDCLSNDCATFPGDTGTNLLKRYCRSRAEGTCGTVNPGNNCSQTHPLSLSHTSSFSHC